MMNRWCVVLLSLWAVSMAGCRDRAPAAGAADSSPRHSRPQPKLPVAKLQIGVHELMAEVARVPAQWERGLMFRESLADNEGMLFVFPAPHRTSFYMKNTTLPLSCAYISPEGVILEIHDLQPLDETPVDAASDQVQYVLETRRGWFLERGLGPGTLIQTERGSLRNAFP
ncbi:MAG TPA: DUF192 domain-containing protein [Candidatus Paceibacterota bacterium]|nr:DUF192 domain-containing protein [Verrucomicrobiota bacterium]HRZ43684.1 DUF192 domain-containing protein [Candidatus Paceibacterota bacterium]